MRMNSLAPRENAKPFAGIDLLAQRPPPGFVLEKPDDGLLDAGLKVLMRPPANLCLDFGGVDGITRVVARAIGDEGDEIGVRVALWCQSIENGTDRPNYVDVLALVAATDIVCLAEAASGRNEVK